MQSSKSKLLSTTMMPLAVLAGMAASDAVVGALLLAPPAYAACNPCSPCNPCAAKKPNPWAAAKCNPCAAAKCNPCAAAACNPCNPCNPCAAGGGTVSLKCAVPRLRSAALCSPCNPCAAKKACSPCNPCAAAKCNPCNPCAAAKCNPCNPCAAANPCNPCNPCAAGGGAELKDAEAVKAYDCLLPQLRAAYAKSDDRVAVSYASWRRYSTQPYQSATHGNRYVQNYANKKAKAYGLYENAGTMPAGATLAKDSFSVRADGALVIGPLFVMEKMSKGFHAASDDWRYTMVMPDGSIFGTTKGSGSAKVEFCIGCHKAVAPEADSMMFIPAEYRAPR